MGKGYQNFLVGLALTMSTAAYAGHGLALGAQPKYPATFTHFDYVNPDAPKGGDLRMGTMGTFDSLNPFVIKGTPAAGLTPLYASYLHATLMASSWDEPFSRYGYVAEDVSVNEDHSAVTFRLRKEARFHDGTPILASDVVWTFDTLKEKGHPLYKAYYKDITKAVAVDAHTVRFDFATKTNRELPLIIGEMPILSQAYFSKHGLEKADLTVPVGSGPYTISEVSAPRRLVYTKVKNWWGANIPVCKGQYNFERVIYDYYRDQTVLFEAFKNGSYDFRLESVASNWAKGYDIAAVKEGKIARVALAFKNPQFFQGLAFNTRRPIFQNPKLREALTIVYNFDWVNKNLFYGQYTRLQSYFQGSPMEAKGVPQGDELALLETVKDKVPARVFTSAFTLPQQRNPKEERAVLERAKALLKEAGYTYEGGLLVDPKTKKPLTFEIILSQDQTAKALQNYVTTLKKIGVTANLRLVDPAQYENRVNTFDFDVIFALIMESISPGNEQLEFWSSSRADLTGARNYAGIKNPAVDALVEHLLKVDTRAQLETAVRALDRVLLWNFYMVPLYSSPTFKIAYWTHLERPKTSPEYNLALDSWWHKRAPF